MGVTVILDKTVGGFDPTTVNSVQVVGGQPIKKNDSPEQPSYNVRLDMNNQGEWHASGYDDPMLFENRSQANWINKFTHNFEDALTSDAPSR